MLFWRRKPSPRPDWLIAGLGNPGGEYEGTRHNVGFRAIEVLSSRTKIELKIRKDRAVFGTGPIGTESIQIGLARPLTFMNLSGAAITRLLDRFHLEPDRLLVIYDEMDLELGRVQVKPKGGAGTHKGMKHIISCLGTEDFPRIRIGIGGPEGSAVEHVLSRFTESEKPIVYPSVQSAATAAELIVTEGIDMAMNRINQPRTPPA